MSKQADAIERIDPLVSVQLRNVFYEQNYRKIVTVFVVSFLVNLMLGSLLMYIVSNPPQPFYFATTINGHITPIFPLSEPNQSTDSVVSWTTNAATAAFTYNFSDYRQEFQSASGFFTGNGWAQFLGALKSSNNLDAVIAKKLIVTAQAIGKSKVLKEGHVKGRYAWQIKVPLLVTYQSTTQFSQQRVNALMVIMRVTTLNAPDGIGIEQLVVEPAEEQS